MAKIAFIGINQAAPWGGSEELWSQTAIRLAKEGYQIGVSLQKWKPLPSQVTYLQEAGCQVSFRWANKSLYQRIDSNLFHGKLALKWLDNFRPDLVVISQAINVYGLNWIEACCSRDIPYVLIVNCVAEQYWPSDEFATRLARGYQRAVRCYFVSKKNIELHEKQIVTPLSNAQIVRNPYKASYNNPPSWPNSSDYFRLACVGRLEPGSKGQDILFEVLRQKKWQERPLKVSLFGRGNSQGKLKELKDYWGLNNVEFGEFVNDVESIWKTHHGLILPSRYEGLPIVIVEAMLCNRMCIVTDVAGNKELIDDNVNGFVAKFPHPESLDEALERAWQKREIWYSLGQKAGAAAREKIPEDPIGVFSKEIRQLLKKLR